MNWKVSGPSGGINHMHVSGLDLLHVPHVKLVLPLHGVIDTSDRINRSLIACCSSSEALRRGEESLT